MVFIQHGNQFVYILCEQIAVLIHERIVHIRIFVRRNGGEQGIHASGRRDGGIFGFHIVSVVQGRDEQIIPPLGQFFARGVDQYPQIGVIQGNGARSRFLGQGGDAYGHAKRNHKQERRKAMNAHDVRYLL